MTPEDVVAKIPEELGVLLREVMHGRERPTAFLDHGVGFLPTIAGISAAQASSLPTHAKNTIAGHVAHVCYYLEVTALFAQGQTPSVDWPASFLPQTVNDAEWVALKERAENACVSLEGLLQDVGRNVDALGGCVANIAHLAYHLGMLRRIAQELGLAR